MWEEQKHHIACLQDPPGIELYTITGHLNKGGVRLPVLRCAWGSTSLESFHLGTAASAVNFQAFLVDGRTRWNSARAAAAIQSSQEDGLRTFDVRLKSKVIDLSQMIHGKAVFPVHVPPSSYTRELFGVEYLYEQTGLQLCASEKELNRKIDEGFEDDDEEVPVSASLLLEDPEMASVAPPEHSDDEAEEEVCQFPKIYIVLHLSVTYHLIC